MASVAVLSGELAPALSLPAVDEEEAFYDVHRAELLEALKSGRHAGLEARGEGGVGLQNQGATCYMNSLLQALFYTPEFRLAVFRFAYDPTIHGEASRCIPLQLQRLFAELQLSVGSAASTKDLTFACGFSSRDAMEQHDVQELCRVLFDALERSAAVLAQEIQRLYSGRVLHYCRSRKEYDGRTYESRREEKFLDIQVPIQDCKTLEQALRQLVEPEVLDGDNRWLCEELDQKVDAFKGVTYTQLPEILCLQLMRFVFDFSTMRRKKITDAISIPLAADFGFLCGESADAGPQLYELAAVLLHSGTAHGGHYHAFIREPGDDRWRDANDSTVRLLGEEQTPNLFRPRNVSTDLFGLEEKPPEEVTDEGPISALHSADAYFVLYRRTGQQPVPKTEESDVPASAREELLARNARLGALQRAYQYHRQLAEVKVYAPDSQQVLLRRHVLAELDGLAGEVERDQEPQLVTINVSTSWPVARVISKAAAAFSSKAAEQQPAIEAWSWVGALDRPDFLSRSRLRCFDAWSGEPKAPLNSSEPLGTQTEAGTAWNHTTLILELAPQGCDEFEAWIEDHQRTILCRWNPELGAPSLAQGDIMALYLPPALPTPATANETRTTAPSVASAAQEANRQQYQAEDDDFSSLFDNEPSARTTQGAGLDRSPLLRTVREAAARLWGFTDPSAVALVALSGREAGTVLSGDDQSLEACGVASGNVICVEEIGNGAEGSCTPRAAALYQRLRNTAHLHFNHPDRPDYPEEFGPLAISKDAKVAELKAKVAEALGLDPAVLHLCKGNKCPQLKDEDRTLRQAGLAESGHVWVGHGAPCASDENMLQVVYYQYINGSHKIQTGFSHSARSSSTVRSFRQALVAPLTKWAAQEESVHGVPPFAAEGLTWQRVRVRDGQAGKQYAILRDELTLRAALLGFGDGRQVAVQVLEKEEVLLPDDIILAVRPWRVREGRLHAPTEIITNKNMSLREFRETLTARYKGLLKPQGGDEPDGATEAVPAADSAEEDCLELVVVPSVGPPLTVKRCETLKWAESRLNPADESALDKALSEYREVRDGVTLVIRSKLAAMTWAAEAAAKAPAVGAGLFDIIGCAAEAAAIGAASLGIDDDLFNRAVQTALTDHVAFTLASREVQAAVLAAKAKAKAKAKPKLTDGAAPRQTSSPPTVARAAPRTERGLVIEVACPEQS